MILINLFPHREEAKKKQKESFFASMALAGIVGVLVSGIVYLYYQDLLSDQEQRNKILNQEIQVLEKQIKEIAGIEGEIAALKSRQKAVEDLQTDRNAPVYLLNSLASQLPKGVYISNMKQDGENISIQGVAQSNERVSEVLKNFSAGWFTKPDLVEIQAGNISLTPKDQKKVYNFNMRFKLQRSIEPETVKK